MQNEPCSKVAKTILPAVRAAVAESLSEKGYTEKEIAEILGIAQAAVSKYLSKKYSTEVGRAKREVIALQLDKSILNYIAKGESKIKINSLVDRICADRRLLDL